MLKYIEESTTDSNVNKNIGALHQLVEKVKLDQNTATTYIENIGKFNKLFLPAK